MTPRLSNNGKNTVVSSLQHVQRGKERVISPVSYSATCGVLVLLHILIRCHLFTSSPLTLPPLSSLPSLPSPLFPPLSSLPSHPSPLTPPHSVNALSSRLQSLSPRLEGASSAVSEAQAVVAMETNLKELEVWLVSCGRFSNNQHILMQIEDHKVHMHPHIPHTLTLTLEHHDAIHS